MLYKFYSFYIAADVGIISIGLALALMYVIETNLIRVS